MGNLLSDLTNFALDAVQTLGYAGVFLFIALETIFPPIPSELILPLAGFQVGQGELNFLGVLVAATVGAVGGNFVVYGLSRSFGESRVRRLTRRFGKFALIDESDIDRALNWFSKYGGTTIIIGRLVPGIRSLISIPAGIERMAPLKFAAYTALGSIIWNTILISLGWQLGREWENVAEYVDAFKYVVILAGVLVVAAFIWKRRNRIGISFGRRAGD